MEEKITSLNIQPQAGVLGVFSRLNYKPWYAIAEFVDNSTQSFYNNEKTLVANGIKTVTVRVEYDFEQNILKIIFRENGMLIHSVYYQLDTVQFLKDFQIFNSISILELQKKQFYSGKVTKCIDTNNNK